MSDYAIVVGVARYPGLAVRGGSADLEGPDNDAGAVRDWLVAPDGGGLDPANVTLVRSADFAGPDPDPEPAAARVERELSRLEERTRDTPGGRLYLYFSGHGFAPVLEEGALFTAEATPVRPSYVYAHAWLRWFRRAGRFREFVLWMDCCMSYRVSIPVNEVLMSVEIATGTPGPAFIGVAAQTREALEHRADDGVAHGVFTSALLAGLRGGAADERARVTGTSLKTFLHNALPEFLPAEVRRAAAVDLRPFVRADDGIVLRRFPARPTHRVTLRAPGAAAGDQLVIWTGRPHEAVVTQPLGPDRSWTGDLVRGLYVVEVPAAGLRQGVAVTGVGDVEADLTEAGPAVVPAAAGAEFALEVVADNPAAAITVTDYRFEVAYTDTGQVQERDLPGVYRVRAELGRDIGSVAEEIILLDRDLVGHRMAAPPVPTPAPVPGSADPSLGFSPPASRDPQTDAAAGISVLVRSDASRPLAGLELFDAAGDRVADLDAEGARPTGAGFWTGRPLAPGAYFLRHTDPDGTAVETSLVVSPDWLTDVTLAQAYDGSVADVAVFMRPTGGGPRAANQDAVIEAARIALAQGRNLFGDGHGARARRLLLAEYLDPVAGIVGAHLLLRAGEPGPAYDAVVRRLRGFVGWTHPDVEALSLCCADPGLRGTDPLAAPPMFRASWDLVVAASYERPGLVPGPLWDRVRAATALGPFLAWAADDATRDTHAAVLGDWVTRVAPDADAARRMGIPAGALHLSHP